MFGGYRDLTVKIGNSSMDYARFGKGEKNLVIIPGLSLRGVKGSALPLSIMYRIFSKDYTVYVFDKKSDIHDGYTIRDIADDTAKAMELLGIKKADVFGVSQGGMAAQYLAVYHPQLVNRLVLAVTASRVNPTIKKTVGAWIEMVRDKNYPALISDMFEKMYSENYLKKYKLLMPVLSRTFRLDDPVRFDALAKACFTCDIYDSLDRINCPVLVIGGRQDKVVTGEASEETAEKLGCDIYMYDGLGHGAYEEAKDFNRRIYDFLND